MSAEAGPGTGRELFVRHARRDGPRVVERCRADMAACLASANAEPSRPGPYTFADAREATAFVTEAVEALMYLGCDIQAA